MSIILGGGTGFIGRALAALLSQNGYKVICVSRSGLRGSPSFSDIISWGDLGREGLPHDCEAVINLAGENLMQLTKRWSEEYQTELVQSRVESTKLLRKLILSAKQKPRAFITASGVGYYKPSNTFDYDEYNEGGNHDFLSRLTKVWEDASILPKESNVRVINIRTGAVLGRDGGVIKSMYWPFFMGVGGPIGNGRQPFPWIHIEDIANLYRFLLENDKCEGKYNGVAPHIVTNAQFTKALAKAMYRPAYIPVPTFPLKALLGPERAKILTEGQRVHPKRVIDAGYEFLFPTIDEACRDVCQTVPQAFG